EHRWVPVRVTRDHAPDSDPARTLGHGGQVRPTLEDGTARIVAADRREVIESPAAIEACLIGELPDGAKLVHCRVLRGELDADAHMRHCHLPGHGCGLTSPVWEATTTGCPRPRACPRGGWKGWGWGPG